MVDKHVTLCVDTTIMEKERERGRERERERESERDRGGGERGLHTLCIVQ